MQHRIAHFISAFGNPLLTIPLFAVIALYRTQGRETALFVSLVIVGGVVVPILIKSYRGVQKGEYTNYDISNRKQRQSWYLFPTLLLAIATLVLYFTNQSRDLILGVFFALVLFIVSQLVNLYIKTSLHVGFNVYLGFLVFPLNKRFAIGVLLFTIILGWSRVVLRKHTLKEVICGAVLGTVVGGIYLWMLQA